MNIYYRHLIDKYNVISFDIFDTLIERNVLIPSDIFEEIGKVRVGNKLAEKYKFERMIAERKARAGKNVGEVNLTDIYSCFDDKNSEYHKMSDEIDYELTHCRIKGKIHDLFQYALKRNKIVILVSDMYLEREVITKILKNCGISGYTNIYLSCESGCSKRNGKLYDFVLKDLKKKDFSIVHFGDDFKSDYIRARQRKIKGVLVLRKKFVFAKIKAAYVIYKCHKYEIVNCVK